MRLALLLALLLQATVAEDPALRAVVERFFATQQAEDLDGYLSLWSADAQRPRPESLKYIFDSGDDVFSDVRIIKLTPAAEGRLRVRVSAMRERTVNPTRPGAPPIVRKSATIVALTLVRAGEEWKIVAEGSATDDLAQSLIDAATPEERAQLVAAEPELLGAQLVSSIARIGSAAAMSQNYPRAQLVFDRALEIARKAGLKQEEGEALQNIANALYFQRKMPEALALYEQRLAIERARNAPEATASALMGIATIRYSYAEYTEALARYREAQALQEKADDVLGLATTLISTGNVLYLQGDYPAAIADYRRSLDLQRTMFNKDGEARALEGLGRTYLAQGDYASALSAFAGVLEEGRARRDRSRQGLATQNIGDAHFRLGNLDASRASYLESKGHYEAAKDLANVGRVWQGLALGSLVATEFARAEAEYGSAITTCTTASDRDCAARATVGLAFAQAAQDKHADAIASYKKAIAEFTALDKREDAARTHVGLSQALSASGDQPAAIAAATHARHEAVAFGNDDVLWRALVAEARAVRKVGDKDKALGILRAAINTIETIHERMLQRPGSSAPSDVTEAFASFAVVQAETGDAAGAFASAERLRLFDLRARLALHERQIARGMTPEEREQEQKEAGALNALHAQLRRERELPRPDAARIASLEQRIADATAARSASQQALFARLPDLKFWRGLGEPASTAELLGVLTADTTVVHFITDEDDVLAVSATRKEDTIVYAASVRGLRRRVLADRIHALLQPKILGDVATWRKRANELARELPGLAEIRAAARAIVIPHESLWRVPFEALPAGAGYVADSTNIVYSGSVSALARGVQPEPAEPGSGFVGIAAPTLAQATLDRLKQTAPTWTLRAADAAERETSSVASVYAEAAQVLKGDAATEPAARERMTGNGALHIAAPFRINGASPLFSPILLAGDLNAAAAENGALELREVMNADVNRRVAVFSDGAAMSTRDGASSTDIVQWGWLASGVRAVVLPRWPMDGATSDAMLVAFHRAMKGGRSTADALRAARDKVRATPETAAPVHWAGWMLLGSPRPIREEVPSARHLDDVLQRADPGDRVEPGIEGPADDPFTPHGRDDRRHGNGRAENRN